MIPPAANLTVRRVPLKAISFDSQPLDLKTVEFYHKLYSEAPAGSDCALPVVEECGDRYVIRDGHHRLAALLICGRPTPRCVVVERTTE